MVAATSEDFLSSESAPQSVWEHLIGLVVNEDDHVTIQQLNQLCHLAKTHTSIVSAKQLNSLYYILNLGLLSPAKEVRASALRAMRLCMKSVNHVAAFNEVHSHLLVAKCLDCFDHNDAERLQALKLVRRMLTHFPEHVPLSVITSVAAIGRDYALRQEIISRKGATDKEQESSKLGVTCICVLAEAAVVNPAIVAQCSGVSVILSYIIYCNQPRLSEALLASVLYLLNMPETRVYLPSDTYIEFLLAPLSDPNMSKERDGNELNACKYSVVSLFRSWAGLMRLCRPDCSGLQTLLATLSLNQDNTRLTVLDILYELFNICKPEVPESDDEEIIWEDMTFEPNPKYSVQEGFIVAECSDTIRREDRARIDVIVNHQVVLLSAFISAGVLETLIDVLISSAHNAKVYVLSTFLLSEMLCSATRLLFYNYNRVAHCLPTLMHLASSFTASGDCKRHQAARCVAALWKIEHWRRNNFPLSSPYLKLAQRHGGKTSMSEILMSTSLASTPTVGSGMVPFGSEHTVLLQLLLDSRVVETDGSEKNQAMDFVRVRNPSMPPDRRTASATEIDSELSDSERLHIKERCQRWNWSVVCTCLRMRSQLETCAHPVATTFVKNLTHYFMPECRLFSAEPLHQRNNVKVEAGIALFKFLVNCSVNGSEIHLKYYRFLFEDFAECLLFETDPEQRKNYAPNRVNVFSATYLQSFMAQSYFIFVGSLTILHQEREILGRFRFFDFFMRAAQTGSNEPLVKLILACLSYENGTDDCLVLQAALKSQSHSVRIYATNFILVLLRNLSAAENSTKFIWAVDLLYEQLFSTSKSVSKAALRVLEEVADRTENLVYVFRNRYMELVNVDDKLGYFLLSRFVNKPPAIERSSVRGEAFGRTGLDELLEDDDSNYGRDSLLTHLLVTWRKELCLKYVSLVDALCNSAFCRHVTGEGGAFVRSSSMDESLHARSAVVPPHLYGELAQTSKGAALLDRNGVLNDLTVNLELLNPPAEMLPRLKASIWAIAHIASSSAGLSLLPDHVLPLLVRHAEENTVKSIRGTVVLALGLVAKHSAGVQLLMELGWESVQRDSVDLTWPVSADTPTLPPLSKMSRDLPIVQFEMPKVRARSVYAEESMNRSRRSNAFTMQKPGEKDALPEIKDDEEEDEENGEAEFARSVPKFEARNKFGFQKVLQLSSSHLNSNWTHAGPLTIFSTLHNQSLSVLNSYQFLSQQECTGFKNLLQLRQQAATADTSEDMPPVISLDKNRKRSTFPPDAAVAYAGITVPMDVTVLFQMKANHPEPTDASSSSAASQPKRENTLSETRDRRRTSSHGSSSSTSTLAGGGEDDWKEGVCDFSSGHNPGTCLKCVSVLPVRMRTGSDAVSTCNSDYQETLEETAEFRKKILELVSRRMSSVNMKEAEEKLRALLQDQLDQFSDLCLYSDVMNLLSHFPCRVSARKFIHSLFTPAANLDLSPLYEQARAVLHHSAPHLVDHIE